MKVTRNTALLSLAVLFSTAPLLALAGDHDKPGEILLQLNRVLYRECMARHLKCARFIEKEPVDWNADTMMKSVLSDLGGKKKLTEQEELDAWTEKQVARAQQLEQERNQDALEKAGPDIMAVAQKEVPDAKEGYQGVINELISEQEAAGDTSKQTDEENQKDYLKYCADIAKTAEALAKTISESKTLTPEIAFMVTKVDLQRDKVMEVRFPKKETFDANYQVNRVHYEFTKKLAAETADKK